VPAGGVEYNRMTRRTALMIGLAGGLTPLCSWAKEFWNDKKPEEWTPDEVALLLNKSPWAREAAISYYGGQNGPLSSTLPGEHSRSSRNASSSTSPSAMSPAAWKAFIRWESALPVRLALKVGSTPDAEKFYILNMVGDVPSIGATPDEDASQRAARFETQRRRDSVEPRGGSSTERLYARRHALLLLARPGIAPRRQAGGVFNQAGADRREVQIHAEGYDVSRQFGTVNRHA
jgi:hypothetical protein